MQLNLETLTQSVENDAGFRRRQRLQPIGGPGSTVFPPTYPGEGRDPKPRHVFERRRMNGADIWSVLLDSVQSAANRVEEALLEEATAGRIKLPYLVVDFTKTSVPEIGRITSLDAPHRIYDAILRDSECDGKPFKKSEVGHRLQIASPANASAILELSPNALAFGAWNSTGEGGGLGAKFPRCLVSEIIGMSVAVRGGSEVEGPTPGGRRPGSRIDPLGILKGVQVFKSPTDWSDSQENNTYKKSKPSEINHGNIAPSIQDLGVTMDYAEHTMVITFAGLRRLRFGDDRRNAAARAMLAALGLVGHYAQLRQGFALRSRCDLVPEEGVAPLELLHSDGGTETVDMDYDRAISLYNDSVDRACAAGFNISVKPTELTPQAKLVYLVKKSRELALADKGGEAAEAAGVSS